MSIPFKGVVFNIIIFPFFQDWIRKIPQMAWAQFRRLIEIFAEFIARGDLANGRKFLKLRLEAIQNAYLAYILPATILIAPFLQSLR